MCFLFSVVHLLALWLRNNKEHENASQRVHGFTLCQQDELASLTPVLIAPDECSQRKTAACVKSSKNFSVEAVVKQQALISEAQKRFSDTAFDIFECCGDRLETLISYPFQEKFFISKCDKDLESQVQQRNKIIGKCSSENSDGCECDVSIVNRRESIVPLERRRSIVTTKVHRQEILRDGEEKATRKKSSRLCDIRPRTLVFETGNRNFTVRGNYFNWSTESGLKLTLFSEREPT